MKRRNEVSIESCLAKRSIAFDDIKSEAFENYLLNEFNAVKLEPYEELHYSRDSNLEVTNTRDSAQKYDSDIDFGVDLSVGHREYHHFSKTENPDDDKISNTKFTSIMYQESITGKKIDTDLIASRAAIKEIMSYPFDNHNFVHDLVVHDGHIFLNSRRSDGNKNDQSMMCGHNFESYITKNKIPVKDNAIKYNTIVNHKVHLKNEKYSALLSCDIDAINDLDYSLFDEHSILSNYIELKCWKNISRAKLNNALIQCYLAGTEKLVVGRRNDNYNLTDIESYDVKQKIDANEESDTAVKHNVERKKAKFSKVFLDNWFSFVLLFLVRATRLRDLPKDQFFSFTLNSYKGTITLKKTRGSERKTRLQGSTFIKWRKELKQRSKELSKPGQDSVIDLSNILSKLKLQNDQKGV